MGLKKGELKGIFCLEGDWEANLKDKSTVEPILRLLEYTYRAPYIRRDIGTASELEYYLRKWPLKRYANYPVLYLAFHGTKKGIYIPEKKKPLDIEYIGELLEDKCRGRIVHFGSCSTLGIDAWSLKRFLKQTDALAVSGYTEDVDWVSSTAFEIFLFDALQDRAFNCKGLSFIENDLKKRVPGLVKELGFRMKVRG